MLNTKASIYRASIATPINLETFRFYEDGCLIINEKGTIEFCGHWQDRPPSIVKANHHYPNSIILPGLIDCHTHLPQYANAGVGDGELLAWLNKYTFPREIQFSDYDFAYRQSEIFFRHQLMHGTTCSVIYCTSHKSAVEAAFLAAQTCQIKTFIGQVFMDRNAPDELLNTSEHFIEQSRELISKFHKNNNKFIVTPRFAISCSNELLKSSATLAKENNLLLQTHLSENHSELHEVQKLFPDANDYTSVYGDAQCLTEKTLLAHCIHLSDSEIKKIKEANARIIHCPSSNRFLASGLMPLRKYLDEKLTIGLGTDISAGYSLSLLNEMKECIETSKSLQHCDINTDAHKKSITLAEAFYLATLGGAKVLHLEKETGSLEKGKAGDFIILDESSIFHGDDLEIHSNSAEDRLARLVYRNNFELVLATYVNGAKVFHKSLK